MGCASSKGEDVQDTAGTRGSKSNKLVVTTAKGANGRLNGQQQDNRGEKEVTVLGYDDADLAEFEREYQADQAKAEAERTHKEETEREEEARAKAAAAEEARRKEEEYIKFEKEQQAEQRALEKDLQEGKYAFSRPHPTHPIHHFKLAKKKQVVLMMKVVQLRERERTKLPRSRCNARKRNHTRTGSSKTSSLLKIERRWVSANSILTCNPRQRYKAKIGWGWHRSGARPSFSTLSQFYFLDQASKSSSLFASSHRSVVATPHAHSAC